MRARDRFQNGAARSRSADRLSVNLARAAAGAGPARRAGDLPNDVCPLGRRPRDLGAVRLLAQRLRLPESDTGDVLWLRNHPVRLFDVMGVVVGLHRARRRWPTAASA